MHKHAAGSRVLHEVGHRSEKLSFRVMKHLPDGGFGLQYRIRDDHDGQERVAIEKALERLEPTGTISWRDHGRTDLP
ncbi:MAG: hypothetical protein N2444_03450 [Methylocystis sp.]|nr:hypothetical protein [Methylocystis sp.]